MTGAANTIRALPGTISDAATRGVNRVSHPFDPQYLVADDIAGVIRNPAVVEQRLAEWDEGKNFQQIISEAGGAFASGAGMARVGTAVRAATSAPRVPVFGTRSLGAAQSPRYIRDYGWSDNAYWRQVSTLQSGKSTSVRSLRTAAELLHDAFPGCTRSRYRGPLSQVPDLRGTYDWHNPGKMIHPGRHQIPLIQIETPQGSTIRIEVNP